MRRSGNIFELDCYRRTGLGNYSGNQILTIVLSIISLIGAICIIANFGIITAKIAIGIVNFLSMGLPVLVVMIAILILIKRLG